MKNIVVFLQLVRFHNLILVFASVLLGGWLETEEVFNLNLALAALSTVLIAAFGYLHNDFCDKEVDRINKPKRPLPQNKITDKEVLVASFFLAGGGVLLGLTINLYAFSLSLLALLLLLAYNLFWKKSFLLGNLIIGLLSAGPFIYGGLASKKATLCLVPAAFSFLFHLGREILKDLEDHQADRHLKARTLPLKLGNKKSLVVITVIFSSLMVLVFWPYLLSHFNQKYLILSVLGVDWLLLYILWSMWKDDSVQNLSRLNSLLKLNMFLGMAAILIGRL